MKPCDLRPGDVVQLDPGCHLGERMGFFAGCFMLVTEPKTFGAQGFICIPRARGESPGHAFYRASWEQMELVGRAVWTPASSVPDGDEDQP